MDIPRIVAPNEISDIVTMILGIMIIRRSPEMSTDAVTIFPGMGEENRIRSGVELWGIMTNNARHQKPFLLVAGINKAEGTFENLNLECLKGKYFLSTWPTENIRTVVHTKNTLEQAEWLRDQVLELKIKSLTLCTAFYHLPRAFLTVLKTFIKANLSVPIIPWPIGTSLKSLSPEVDKPQHDLIPGEIERILEYQKTGNVATKAELEEYLKYWF